MSERRRLTPYASACGLLAAGLLAALAVFSRDPGDVAGQGQPGNAVPHNLFGYAGACLADALTEALGAAVHVLLLGWIVLALLLFLSPRWWRWSARLVGWLLLVPTAAAVVDFLAIPAPGDALAGPGGSLGAWLVLWLQGQLAPPGPALLLAGTLLCGLLLTADTVFWRLLRLGWRSATLLARTGKPAPAADPVDAESGALDAILDEEQLDPSASLAPPSGPSSPRDIPIYHHSDVSAVETFAPSDQERFADFELPSLSLLEDAQPFSYAAQDQELRDRAALLEKTFTDFGLKVRVVGINTGPVVTQFEVALETGLRLSKVTSLADDVALNLSAASVRMVAPIPGKNTVGIEIPNEVRADVRLKEVLLASGKKLQKCKIPLFLGKDSEGRPLVYDLADMPHLLIAGSTGTGKSVCMNAIILSMLMTRRPDEVKMILIDPKVVELSEYGKMPHLMHPVVSDMKKAEAILAWAVDKMEERYDLLGRARVRNIAGYNELKPDEVLRRLAPETDEDRSGVPRRIPYIVIVIDEMSDLILQMKKEVEGHIIRLSQKSRAAGIHLVLATQKPTVDVITGLIKSNLPSRICFKVASKSDSRVVLDQMGADKLLGKGDMLFLPPGTSNLVRAQGTYASEEEIRRVTGCLESDPCFAAELLQLKPSGDKREGSLKDRLREDELYEPAIEVIIREGRGSVSLLQRALGIGYGRASRLIDFMAEDGIVGAYNGSNAREVLYSPEQWAAVRTAGSEA
jgi:S-DNA-T family DNA segregation ATPase FtsK/SpoIIIE